MTGIDVDALTDEWAQIEYEAWQANHAGGIPKQAWDDLGLRVKASRRNQVRDCVAFVAARVEQDVRQERDEALRLLALLVDPDPCWFDHHGNCQAHNLEQPCSHELAKQLLARGGSDAN